MVATATERRSIAALTPKQREVLALLAEHRSAKEIAEELGVSANTVHKHLDAVRARWHTRTRQETARVYHELVGDGEKLPPQIFTDDEGNRSPSLTDPDLPIGSVFRFEDVIGFDRDLIREIPAPAGLEELDRRFGKWWRAGAILAAAVLLGMVAIWGLSFALTLSSML